MKFKLNVKVTLDLGSMLAGAIAGFLAYPIIFDDANVKKIAKKGAVKEVGKSLFRKKD